MDANIGCKWLALFALLTLHFEPAKSIECYQCTSSSTVNPFQCTEFLSSDIDMKPEPCDKIYGAQYCVKVVGRLEVLPLECYQCATADEWKCTDGDLTVEALQPQSCDHIFEAKYCIKSVGRYGDGIGTKRFCSSKDRGNSCEYVRQPGDKLTYRTCIYTCTGDGCNPASGLLPSILTIISGLLITLRFLFHR
ncbi:uncharacterized protein LOC107265040 isoform X2 [Cephus cinctus]|uniref:Uncharacterized protein LOC107265040 isoform X2 n=1 Tax=Cephus cinctus TaxID=211228 RepID=A0AAJ7BM76_CEPCN|nr:uncharacterized protein LOC107265040 isoform X2 [Cephus cinctus]